MPDGYRRGGSYTRNGRTFQRRGAKIKGRGLLVGAGVLIGFTALTGGSLVGSPVLIASVAVVAVGALVYRHRRSPVMLRLNRWANPRYQKRNTRPALLARKSKPRELRRTDGAYLDARLRPHARDGRFIPVKEWEAGLPDSWRAS